MIANNKCLQIVVQVQAKVVFVSATQAAYVILHFSRSLRSFRSIVTGFVSLVTSANSATGIWLMTSALIGTMSFTTFWHSDVGDGKTSFGRSLSQQSTSGQNS